MLLFAAGVLQAETSIYVGTHFEVREHDAPVKYIFNGNTRVGRITGSLSANERIQKLRLRAGWNLVSLAVTATNFLNQLGQLTSGPTPVIKALYRWQPATKDYVAIASAENVAAGTVLWVSAQTDAVVAVRGGYVEPNQWQVAVGGTYLATPALEAQPLTVPADISLWRYDARNSRWQAALTGDLASLKDLPSTLAPGEAIYVHSNEPADLEMPAREERIRYYHQDHLGSSSVMTDANGTLIEENAFYPFGVPRHEHRLRQIEEAYKFTQKERDRESGLHYFEARYLVSSMSRFLSVDPKYANSDSPVDDAQALNLYAYVRNNPLRYTDPTGLDQYSEIAHAAAVSDTKAAAGEGTLMGIMQVAVTIDVGVCDYAFGCGMGGYQLTRQILVEGYNVDTDSKLYKGSAVVGVGLSLAVPVPPVLKFLGKTEKVAVTAGEGGTVAAGKTLAGGWQAPVAGGTTAKTAASGALKSGGVRGGNTMASGGAVKTWPGGADAPARVWDAAGNAAKARNAAWNEALAGSPELAWSQGMIDAARARGQLPNANVMSLIADMAELLFRPVGK